MPMTSTGGERTDPPVATRLWELVRVGLAGTYLLGGMSHLVLAVTSIELYESFADRALVGAYTEVWTAVVVPRLAVLVPLVGLFELAVGGALLWRGRAVRMGHAAGAVFQVALVLSGPWGVVNAALALVHWAGRSRVHPRSVLERPMRWLAG